MRTALRLLEGEGNGLQGKSHQQLSKFRTLEDEELQNAYKMNHRLYRMINTATSGATWLKPNILIYDTVGQRIMFLAFFVVHFFVLNFII
ncbi:uncharacterized protein LOC122509309 isoform X2 [Leptopilina heterotoma]|uniref:uncharacterized protein LOC122509309 isoform X2 n=1 Tax=Leptopilina heterotoma TaxID=63436 RepID=UPI001CAA3F64|nr:uncharacterized protein LOC122509309 isoform X2 [Leptopilina heterotoma]